MTYVEVAGKRIWHVNARLAVLPGTHALPIELPGVVNPLLTWFLQHDITADASSGR
jgi:hypothetical protein